MKKISECIAQENITRAWLTDANGNHIRPGTKAIKITKLKLILIKLKDKFRNIF